MKDWSQEIPAGESFKLEDGQGAFMPTKQMFPDMPMYLVKAIPCDEEGEVVHLGAVLERLEAKVDGLLEKERAMSAFISCETGHHWLGVAYDGLGHVTRACRCGQISETTRAMLIPEDALAALLAVAKAAHADHTFQADSRRSPLADLDQALRQLDAAHPDWRTWTT